jgi:hypothetical protein
MKTFAKYVMTIILVLTVVSCGTTSKEIKARAESIRSDVFREIADGDIPAANTVDLLIRTHIKTHLEGHYILEPGDSLHGKPGYPFMFNIDGQSVIWKVDGVKEETARYDENGKRIAEGGPGMKYSLEKKVRLAPGKHTIYTGLSEDDYAVEFEVTLAGGEQHLLELKPEYMRYGKSPRSFKSGISRYDVLLDGSPIPVGRRHAK